MKFIWSWIKALFFSFLVGFSGVNLQAATGSGYSEYYVPGDENNLLSIFRDLTSYAGTNQVPANDDMYAIISVTAIADNTKIHYDHWENGYETDLTDAANADEVVTLNKGEVRIFKSRVRTGINRLAPESINECADGDDTGSSPTYNLACYDGRDRFFTTGGPVTVSRASWTHDKQSVLGVSWEVYPSKALDADYTMIFGEDLAAAPKNYTDFQLSYYAIQAVEDGTDVSVNGTIVANLNMGEEHVVMHNSANDQITSSKPLQIKMISGAERNWEARGFTAVPEAEWSNTYYVPVGSINGGTGSDVYLYNPNSTDLTINWEDKGGSGTFIIPAGETLSFEDGAGRLVASESSLIVSGDNIFWGVATIDTESSVHDWGHSLIPDTYLKDEYLIGWTPGSLDNSENYSPLFVAPTVDGTTIFVDLPPVDGIADITVSGDRFDMIRIYNETGSNDLTGSRVWATRPIALVWGQDPNVASTGNPALDMGYTTLPQRDEWLDLAFSMEKSTNSPSIGTDAGQQVTFSLLFKSYAEPLTGVEAKDILPVGWSYVAGTARIIQADGTILSGTSADPVVSGQELVWNAAKLGGMGPDQNITVYYDAITIVDFVAGTVTTNQVEGNASNPGGTVFGSSDGQSTKFVGMDVNKTSTPENSPLMSGNTIDYNIQVKNTSPLGSGLNLNNIVVSDPLPAGISLNGACSIVGWNIVSVIAEDDFSSNGTGWVNDWSELTGGEEDGLDAGDIQIINGTLRLKDNDNGGDGVERTADFTGYTTATLSFDFTESGLDDANDFVTVKVSVDGGPLVEVVRFSGGDANTSGEVEKIISVGPDTVIEFKTSPDMGNNDVVTFDNVKIEANSKVAKSGSCDAFPNIVTALSDYDLMPGDDMNITFQVILDDPLAEGINDINNTVEVLSDELQDPFKDTVSDPVNNPVNLPPETEDKTNVSIVNTAAATGIVDLNGTDSDGTVDFFVIKTLPVAAHGVLYMADGTTAVTVGQELTPSEAAGLTFDPVLGNTVSATFTYASKDNDGLEDATPATVTIPMHDPVNNPPTAMNDTASVDEDASVDINVTVNDSDPDGTIDTSTVVITQQPTNGTLSVDPVTGVVTYTPNSDYNGPDSFKYTVEDNEGLVSNEATVNITVNSVNDIPKVDTEIPDQNSEDGNTTSVDVSGNFSDPDGNTLTYTATGLPAGLTISSAGVISGTIDNSASQGGTNGIYSVTVTANDGNGGTVSDTFTWTVTNPAPTATDNNNTTNEDTPVSGNVISDDDGNGVDSDPDGDTLSVTQFVVGGSTYTAGQTAALTEGNLTIASNGAYTFTTAANSTANMPQATYTVSDGEDGTDTATLDIVVNSVNDVPVANPDLGNTDEDTQLVVNAANGVLSNDSDVEGDTLEVTEYNVGGNSATVGSPLVLTEGNLTIASDGSYTFDPAPDFHGPVPAVTYSITDNNGGTASSTLTITVDSVNDAPVAEDDSQSTPVNTPVAVPVLNNDHDPEDDSLIILDVNTTDTNGTVVWDENGTVIFTPDTDFIGTTTFTYTVDDGNGGTDTATVTITVTDPTDPANNAVTAVADSASTEADTDIDIPVLINDYDPEGDEFNLTSIATQPVNGTATINDNGTAGDPSDDYVTYAPNAGFVGNDTFEYEITDENGNTDIAIVTVTVVDAAADAIPNAVADAATTDEDMPVTIDVLGNDTHPDMDDLNISAFTQPANGVVTLDDGGTPGDPSDDELVYTPNPGFYGNDTFMYTITDSNGDTASASVTVTIVENGTVIGIVYEDLDGNGVQDSGEPGVADVNITITDSNGNTYDVTTDVNGTYSQEVPEGNVTIDIDESPYEAVIQTEGTNPTTLFVPSGGTVNDVDGYIAPLGRITVGTPRPPIVGDDSVDGVTGTSTTVDVIGNDAPGTYPLDPESVSLVPPSNATNIVTDGDGDTIGFTVPGEGEWSVDPLSGELTFTPESGFIGDPTPIEYTVLDTSGASDGGTITINFPPVANDDSNLSLEEGETAILDVLANDENTTFPLDPERVSLVAPLNAIDIVTDADGDVIGFRVPDEGEWSVDETTGVVSFIPDTGISDDPTPISYTVRETNGDESNEALLTVSYKRLILTLNAFCENDVPYINYDIQAVGFDATGETATLTWTSADGMSTQVESNLTLSNTHHLWAGAQVDSSGNGIVWPGWNELPDGSWEIVYSDWRRWNADQSDATLTVTLSVNPTSSVTVEYPPATSACQANPVPVDSVNPPVSVDSGLPYATDNLNILITSYSPTVIDVLANGDAWGSNGPGNVAISFTQPTYGTVGIDDGGTPNDPTDDVLLYTPKADVNEVKDSFTYTITDAAGNTATARVTLDVNCASSQTSDSGDALGVVSMLILAIMTLMTGLYFVRKEEERGNI